MNDEESINPLVPHAWELALGGALLFGTVVFGLLALVDASRRGRSVPLWILAFALTGPFGVVAYYVTRGSGEAHATR